MEFRVSCAAGVRLPPGGQIGAQASLSTINKDALFFSAGLSAPRGPLGLGEREDSGGSQSWLGD